MSLLYSLRRWRGDLEDDTQWPIENTHIPRGEEVGREVKRYSLAVCPEEKGNGV